MENSLTTFNTLTMPWEELWNEHLGKKLYRKNLIEDPGAGVEIRILRYPGQRRAPGVAIRSQGRVP